MPWLSALFLALSGLLIGWIPLLGPLALGFLAGRAERGVRAPLALLPALALQTLGLLAARLTLRAVENHQLGGWLWTLVGWLFSPLAAWLGRPLEGVIAGSSALGFLLLFTLPVLPGLLLGSLSGRRKG